MNGNDVVDDAVRRAAHARAEEIRLRPIYVPSRGVALAAAVACIAILAAQVWISLS